MNVKKYFKDVNIMLDNLSDQEFIDLLNKSGIESCAIKKDELWDSIFKNVSEKYSSEVASEVKFEINTDYESISEVIFKTDLNCELDKNNILKAA